MDQRQKTTHLDAGLTAEADRVSGGTVAAWGVSLSVVLLVIVFVLLRYFSAVTDAEIYAKQIAPIPTAVLHQRAETAERLSVYERLDSKKGVYRIPIGRAIDYLVAHPKGKKR